MRNGLLLTGSLVALLIAGTANAQSAGDAADVFEATGEAVEAAAPATEAAPAPAVTAEAPAAPMVAPTADYDLQLHELEDRLNELKESVFASKARLRMLWHQLMQEGIGGSRIAVTHINELGGLFDLARISYAIDGDQVYATTAADEPALNERNRVDVYESPVLAGPHTIVVQAEIVGNDHGMFSYMNGYTFSLVSSHSFTVEDGKTADVDVILYDHGGASRALEDRPDVRFDVSITDTIGDDSELTSGDEES